MAKNIGGDLVEVTVNHPNLGTRTFFPKANEDSTFDTGGVRTDDDADSVTGRGDAIYKKNFKRWSLECVCAQDMNSREDVDFLVSLSESSEEGDWTVEHINGTIYGGKGKPVGDLNWNGNASTFTLKISGSGRMSKIAG